MPNKKKRMKRANHGRWYEKKLNELDRIKRMEKAYPLDPNGKKTLDEEGILIQGLAAQPVILNTPDLVRIEYSHPGKQRELNRKRKNRKS